MRENEEFKEKEKKYDQTRIKEKREMKNLRRKKKSMIRQE